MRLLLDEHISPIVAEQLRSRGHDAVAALEVSLTGVDDPGVLAWAASARRAVVTSNIQDFRPLHAASLTRGAAHHGIILVPTSRYSLRRDRLGTIVAALDQLLTRLPEDSALCDREHFL